MSVLELQVTEPILEIRDEANIIELVAGSQVTTLTAPITFTQNVPLSPWVINHNLGWKPQVTVVTNGGIEMDAQVQHMSLNQVQITFTAPQVGQAIIR